MPVMTVQIEGLEELLKNIDKVAQSVTPEHTKAIYHEGAKLIRERAKQLAPYDPTRKKGTHLRDAIFTYTRNPRESFVLVGVRSKPKGAPHAHLLEYGHATRSGGVAPARSYMRPALTQMSKEARDVIIAGLRNAIEEATSGLAISQSVIKQRQQQKFSSNPLLELLNQ